MSTVNAITASGEGAGLSKVDAFKTAMEAVVSVVKQILKQNNRWTSLMQMFSKQYSKKLQVAISKGVDEKSFV